MPIADKVLVLASVATVVVAMLISEDVLPMTSMTDVDIVLVKTIVVLLTCEDVTIISVDAAVTVIATDMGEGTLVLVEPITVGNEKGDFEICLVRCSDLIIVKWESFEIE